MGESKAGRIRSRLVSGSDLILKNQQPFTVERSGTLIEILAGRVWISQGAKDFILGRGECYTVVSTPFPTTVVNLGKFPSTIRIHKPQG